MSQGEKSQGEMSQGEMSLGEKCRTITVLDHAKGKNFFTFYSLHGIRILFLHNAHPPGQERYSGKF